MNLEQPNRDNETDEVRRKRLIYQSNYRGFKEADLLLGGFAKAYMGELSADEVDQFEALLSARDHDIMTGLRGGQRFQRSSTRLY